MSKEASQTTVKRDDQSGCRAEAKRANAGAMDDATRAPITHKGQDTAMVHDGVADRKEVRFHAVRRLTGKPIHLYSAIRAKHNSQ